MVAHTQTLLSVFGSRVVLPTTGVLMNNGMMWFDPRPESPNYFAPAKRPLTNMCPLIARRGEHGWFSIGASGGRKIMTLRTAQGSGWYVGAAAVAANAPDELKSNDPATKAPITPRGRDTERSFLLIGGNLVPTIEPETHSPHRCFLPPCFGENILLMLQISIVSWRLGVNGRAC